MFYMRLQLIKIITGLSTYEIAVGIGYSMSHLAKVESFLRAPSYKLEKALEQFIERNIGREGMAQMDELIRLSYKDFKEGTWA